MKLKKVLYPALFLLLQLGLLSSCNNSPHPGKAVVYEELKAIPTYPYSDPSPVPSLAISRDIAPFYPYSVFDGYSHYSESRDYRLVVLKVPVSPGNYQRETEFVDSIEPELLRIMHDNSDAVLVAAALKTGSMVLTKDRHHIFTAALENFVGKYNIKIVKNLHEI